MDRSAFLVVVLAIVLRATAAWLTVDVPGDGPVRGHAGLSMVAVAHTHSLRVTVPDDASYRRCLERGLGGAIGPQHLVHTVGPLQVFDIRHLTNPVPSVNGGVATSYRPGPE
jgi:hypothetical protein